MFDHASMNRAYRLVWSDRHNAYVVAAETARGRGQRAVRGVAALLLATSVGVNAQTVAPTQLPTGGRVAAGQANIVQAPARLDIHQSSNRAVIDWQTFNVGSAAQVNFNQPGAQAVTLNRVLDAQPSQIFGRISANGQVFLTNPNGVYFSPTARVDVGGLAATTHTMDVASFMAGGNTFNRNGSTGAVSNQGVLNAAAGGYIALLAPEVRNEGIVTAQAGTVALAAGEAITLNITGANTLAGITATPAQIQALVENKHVVFAPGGTVILSAQAADRLQGGVINNIGSIEANGIAQRDGRIVLEAAQITNAGALSASGGGIELRATNSLTQTASGRLSVAGERAGGIALKADYDVHLQGGIQASASNGTGGTVAIEGETIRLAAQSSIDARGATGGGTVLVGGDWQGSGALRQARKVVMEKDAVIDVSATRVGDGGKAVLWSDITDRAGETRFAGRIQAQGAGGGKGGRVETSGHVLGVTGSVRAGKGGQWLLDPYDITIANAGDQNVDPSFNATGSPANVDASSIEGALSNGVDVTVFTGVSGNQAGDITLAADIRPGAMSGDATLTLKANNSIFVNTGAVIDATQGGNTSKLHVLFWANAGGTGQGRIDIGANAAIYTNGGNIVMGGGSDITTGYAIGTGSGKLGRGIWVRDGTVFDAGGGDITLRGQGQNGAKGVAIGDPNTGSGSGATLLTSGNGAISITGVGTTGLSGNSPSGVYLHDDVRLQTGDGAITLNGTGGVAVDANADNSGVRISSGARILSDSGMITLHGVQGSGAGTVGAGVRFSAGTSYLGHDNGTTIARSFSDIVFSADSFNGAGASVVVNTGGALTFQPADTSFSNPFTWSGSMSGADFVGAGTLAGLRVNNLVGLSALTLGNRGNLANMAIASPLTLGGALNLFGGDVQLLEQINVQNQILTVTNTGVLTTAAGKTVTADGGFTQDGTGTSSLGGNIVTNGAPIRFAGDVTVRDQIAMNSNGGSITFDGALTGSSVTVPARLALDSGNSGIQFNGVVSNFDRLSLNAWGTVAQTARAQVQNLVATGEGDFNLTHADNQIGTLAANIGSGSLVVNNAAPLIIGSVQGVNGIVSNNTVQVETAAGQTLTVNQPVTSPSPTLIAGGNLQLNAPVTATMGDLLLATGGAFINTAGANALATPGRWLVYSQSPASNNFGGLASGHTGLFGKTRASYGPADVTNHGYSGNRFLFATTETITVTTTDAANLYGAAPASLAGNYQIAPINTYGGAIVAPSLSGTPAIASSGASSTAHAGSYAINADVSGMLANAPGYDFAANNAGTLTIAPRPVSLSGGRVYDATTAIGANQMTIGGVVNGDTLGISGTGVLSSKNVGTQTLAGTGSLVLSNSDYTLNGATSAFNITPATLSVSGVGAHNKIYDATTQATLGGTPTVNPFGADVVTLGGAAIAQFGDKNAGNNKPVSVSGYTLSGADAANYLLQQPVGLTANITPATLAVSGLSAQNKTYDATTQATLTGSATINPLASDMVTLNGNATAVFGDKHVGSGKALSVSGFTLTGADAANYVLQQPAGLTANIMPAPLAVNGVVAQNKVYDGTTAATLAGTAAIGVLGTDAVALNGNAIANFGDAAIGNNKAVTVSGYTLSGVDAGNYQLQPPAGLYANIIAPLAPPPAPPSPPPATAVTPVSTVPVPLLTAATDFASWLTPVSGGALDVSAALGNDGTIRLTQGPVAPFVGAVPVVVAEATPGSTDEYRFSLPRTLQESLARAGMQRVTLSRIDHAPLPKWLQYDAWNKRLVATQMPPGELPLAVLITMGTQKAVVKIDLPASARIVTANASAR